MIGHDILICEMPIMIDGVDPDSPFHTRAFDCVFEDVYRITADGKLILATEGEQTGPRLGLLDCFCGDLIFWEPEKPQKRLIACFSDGICLGIISEDQYVAALETARKEVLTRVNGATK